MPAYDLVVVHPLVLLSVVDHYNRVAKDTKKRVVGILLGETYKGRVDITNCFAGAHLYFPIVVCTIKLTITNLIAFFAVPFEEDDRDPNIWFLDHSYLEGMSAMFKKVNGRKCIHTLVLACTGIALDNTLPFCSQGANTGVLQHWSTVAGSRFGH